MGARIVQLLFRKMTSSNDVVKWIEATQTVRMIDKIDDNEKGVNNIYTLGGNQEMRL